VAAVARDAGSLVAISAEVPAQLQPAEGGSRPRSRLVAAGFICAGLTLILPPLGLAAIVIGIILLVRGRIGTGVAILLLGLLVPLLSARSGA
jgi:hypothetical protein